MLSTMFSVHPFWQKLWQARLGGRFFRLGIGLVLLVALCIGALGLVSMLPAEAERAQLVIAKDQGAFEQDRPKYLLFRGIDMYTECVGISASVLMEPTLNALLGVPTMGPCPALAAGLSTNTPASTPYPRYWHGYLVVLKPLYTLLSIWHVRVLVFMVSAGLMAGLFFAARARLGTPAAAVLVGSFLTAGTLHVFMLVTHGVQFWLVLAGGIAALRCRGQRAPVYLFGLLGGLDAFFSFLSMGSMSLALPLLCYCLARWSDGDEAWRIAADALWGCVAWSMGLVLLWCTKWVLVYSLLPPMDMFGLTLEAYPGRGVGMFLRALYNNINSSLCRAWIPLALLLGWRMFRQRIAVPEGLWIVVLPALMPLVWMAVLPGQSGIKHYSFVSIILWPTLAAGLFLLLGLPRKATSFRPQLRPDKNITRSSQSSRPL